MEDIRVEQYQPRPTPPASSAFEQTRTLMSFLEFLRRQAGEKPA